VSQSRSSLHVIDGLGYVNMHANPQTLRKIAGSLERFVRATKGRVHTNHAIATSFYVTLAFFQAPLGSFGHGGKW
jgi:hypothetical protein